MLFLSGFRTTIYLVLRPLLALHAETRSAASRQSDTVLGVSDRQRFNASTRQRVNTQISHVLAPLACKRDVMVILERMNGITEVYRQDKRTKGASGARNGMHGRSGELQL